METFCPGDVLYVRTNFHPLAKQISNKSLLSEANPIPNEDMKM
jgi:hypothetical protein